ncbi:hypothetical protein LTR74_014300 [Friedmanniomyces endolithicus]|nr:hypothetical protein LTR74_014300 [Friedmanniomyces endolithicus]
MSKRERSASLEPVEWKHARFTMEMPIRTRPAPIARLGDEIRGGGDTGGESPRRTEVVEQRYSKRLRKKREQEELEYGDEEWEGFGDWEPGDLLTADSGDHKEGGEGRLTLAALRSVEGNDGNISERLPLIRACDLPGDVLTICRDDGDGDDEGYAHTDINVELTSFPKPQGKIDHTGAIAKYWGPGRLDQLLDQKLIPKEVVPLNEPSGGAVQNLPVERWPRKLHHHLAVLALSAELSDANHHLLEAYEERRTESGGPRLGLQVNDVWQARNAADEARHRGVVRHPRDNPRI